MEYIKRLVFENIVNCRDLGGFVCRNGVTKFGKFLRCGIPVTPTQDDIIKIMAYGIKTVIDLRGKWESENSPSVFKYLSGIEYHNVCLFEANASVSREYTGNLEKSYEISIEEYKENYKKVLDIIADAPEGGILLHCYFGKDRTGMLSAILLSIAGAMPEDIIADYQVSYTYILSFIEKEKSKENGTMWETNDSNFLSDANNMAALLNFVNSKYGSVIGYVKSIGVTDETIEKIRKRFLL